MDKDIVYIYIYNGVLPSHKKNKIMPSVATWIDLEIVKLTEVSLKKKDKYHRKSFTCGV